MLLHKYFPLFLVSLYAILFSLLAIPPSISRLCHLILFHTAVRAYDQQTQMMQIGQNKQGVTQIVLALLFSTIRPFLDCFNQLMRHGRDQSTSI